MFFFLFLSGPLFDRVEFERVSGEAPLVNILVPAETGNILRLLGMDDMRPWQEALRDYMKAKRHLKVV